MKQFIVSAALIAVLTSEHASARILAVCGASKGKAYYVAPEESGWADDTISNGSFTFLIDDKGKPDILIKDASGKTFSVVESGDRVVVPFQDETSGTFTFIFIGESSSVGTYQVSQTENGRRVLLWTDSKNRGGGFVTKVSAWISECEAR